jgi:hypothetical protein
MPGNTTDADVRPSSGSSCVTPAFNAPSLSNPEIRVFSTTYCEFLGPNSGEVNFGAVSLSLGEGFAALFLRKEPRDFFGFATSAVTAVDESLECSGFILVQKNQSVGYCSAKYSISRHNTE